MNTYLYYLTFGKNIKDAQKVVPALTLDQSNQVDLDIDDVIQINNYKVSLGKVEIHKKIYQPCEIKAELIFNSSSNPKSYPTPKQISDILLQRLVTFKINVNSEKDSSGNLLYNPLAENYYVHEIYPELTKGENLKVKLCIYSIDKLMTLQKYSKAHVAKKLSKIFSDEIEYFGFRDRYLKTDEKIINNLRSLIYNENGEKAEFVQPYLVQYNESFYDFMLRTSNRCGEFMYFENGILHLGWVTPQEDISIKEYSKITFKSESVGPLEIIDYHRDSVKDIIEGKDAIEKSSLNYEAIDPNASGYPNDSFTEAITYNAELANDEYYFYLYKDKFNTVANAMGVGSSDDGIAFALKQIKTGLADTNGGWLGLAEVIFDIAWNISNDAREAGITSKKDNDSGYDILKNLETTQKDDKTNPTKGILFANLAKESWTTVNYYRDIRAKEEEQNRQTICIDMGTNYVNVMLGSKIHIDGLSGNYLVTQIEQVLTGSANDKQSQKIYAIPITLDSKNKDVIVPPLLPIPFIRKSGPQTAFVSDNSDNKRQGRVRIAFPWQTLAQNEKVALADATRESNYIEEQIATNIKETNELRKKRAEEAEKLRALYALKDQQATDVINEYNKIKASLEARKAEVDNFINDENTYKTVGKEQTTVSTGDKSKKADLETKRNTAEKSLKEKEEKLDKLNKKSQLTDNEETEKKTLEDEIPLLKKKIIGYDVELDNLEKKIAAYKKEQTELQTKITEITKTINDLDTNSIKKEELEKKIEEMRRSAKAIVDEIDKQIVAKEEERKALEHASAKAFDSVKAKADAFGKAVAKGSSPWVRVVMPMATQGGGVWFAPQKGDEVLVNFDNDNVERPYVVGSLYSKNLNDPNVMGIVSPNGHQITFDNPSDGSKFFESLAPAIKLVGKNTLGFSFMGAPEFFGSKTYKKSYKDGMASCKDFTGGITFKDRYGFYQIDMATQKRQINISSPVGKVKIDAFQGITVSAPNGDVTIEGKNVTIKAGNNLTLQSGINVRESKSVADTAKGIVAKYAGNVIKGVVGDSLIDLDLIRTILEVAVRPIEGTTLIKSKRYLKLEAGDGNTMVQRDRYKLGHRMKHRDEEMFAYRMQACITAVQQKYSNFFTTYKELKDIAFSKKEEYDQLCAATLKDEESDKYPDVMKKAFQFDTTQPWKDNPDDEHCIYKVEDYTTNGILSPLFIGDLATRKAKDLQKSATAYGTAIFNLHKHVLSLTTLFEETKALIEGDKEKHKQEFEADVKRDGELAYKKAHPNATPQELDTAANGNLTILKMQDKITDYPCDWVDKAAIEILEGRTSKDIGLLTKWKDRFGDADPKTAFMNDSSEEDKDPLAVINSTFFLRTFAATLMLRMSEHSIGKRYIDITYLIDKTNDEIREICKDDAKWAEFIDNMNRSNSAAARLFYDILVQPAKDLIDKNILQVAKWRLRDAEHWDDSKGGQILFSTEKGQTIRIKGDKLKVDAESVKYTDNNYKKLIKGLK